MSSVTVAVADELVEGTSLWRDAWRRLKKNRMAVAGGAFIVGLTLACLLGPLVSLFGQSLVLLFLALGLVEWLATARIVRGQVLSLKEKEFILAARSVGTRAPAIILRHLIPNTLGPIIVYFTLTVPEVILQEA